MELKDLCGKHTFSGADLSNELIVNEWGNQEWCDVCCFILDDITYIAIEDPSDGYRSYCKELLIYEESLKNTFPSVEVLCHMKDDGNYNGNDVLVIRDVVTGNVILEVGTMKCDDDYPYCHFEYHPENMSCNQEMWD